jgi:C-terminal peptidase prc
MTKSKFLGLLGVCLVAAAAVLPARADRAAAPSGAKASQPYIVLVGISKYDDPHILPRPHAEQDAKALYDLFTNKDYLGVDPGHVRLLLGKEDAGRKSEPATHAKILEALTWAARKARADDLVVFAFIGEGAPLHEKTCYFASDSTFKKREKNSVSATEIEKVLATLKTQQFCAFIDVNFKGFDLGKAKAPDVDLTKLFREFIGKEEDENASLLSSRAVFLANTGLKPSLDLDKHGVLTQALLDGLKGKADKDGYEPDGLITVEELAKYVRAEVPVLVKKYGKTDEQKKQKPVILEMQSSNFTLTYNPAVMPTVRKRLARIDELARENAITKKVALQGKALLSKMPKLEAQRELRKAFEKLADGTLEPKDFKKERSAYLSKTRLSREDAREFGVTIAKAIRMIKVGYVKDENPGQLADWAIRGLFRRLDEKLPPEITERLAQAKRLKKADATTLAKVATLLTDVRAYLGKREDLANYKDVTYTLNGMLSHLDKHTDYISPEILDQMRIDTTGEYYGIGAHIRQNTNRDMLQIVSPIYGSPAYKAGLRAGDIVTKIKREVDSQGLPLEKPQVVSTKGLPTEEAVKLIKGRKGTKVKLVVEREGVSKPFEVEIARDKVELETVLGFKRGPNDRWNFYLDPEKKIVYVRLTQFARNTYRDLYRVMKKLNGKGINGMVLDLRFNPGGLLDSAVKVSDLFVDDGVIVTIKPRRGRETVYIGKHEGSYLDFPMVCLVNDSSASGSEIVSACLQDHGRAIIMGERSYGKGSVQTILPFEPTGGQLKMTNATFWRPSNKNLNKSSTKGRPEDEWGVTPDAGYLLKMSVKDQDSLFDFQREQEIIKRRDLKAKPFKPGFKDPQLEMALKYLRGQIRTAAKREARKKAG